MGTDFEMSPIIAVFLLLLLSIDLEVEGNDCCEEKKVGSVSYTLHQPHSHTLPDQCLDNCVYTILGSTTPKYCFQQGDLPTECLSDTTTTTTSRTTPTTTPTTTTSSSGILVLGGWDTPFSVEFWSASRTCVLTNYPREMKWGPTVNLVSGGLVACYYPDCEIYQNGAWQRLQNTIHRRERHSSVAVEDAVLLIGG